MKNFNKRHKPKHFSKARWYLGNLWIVSMKEKYVKYVKTRRGYCLIRKNSNKNKDKTFKQNIFKLCDLGVGKKFMFENNRYKVIKSNNCNECDFKEKGCFQLRYNFLIPECSEIIRKDETGVIFIKVKKE